LYPWHPWGGQAVQVDEAVERGTTIVFRCGRHDAVGPSLEVPAWMFDQGLHQHLGRMMWHRHRHLRGNRALLARHRPCPSTPAETAMTSRSVLVAVIFLAAVTAQSPAQVAAGRGVYSAAVAAMVQSRRGFRRIMTFP
jgi:hypothetical protein